MPQAGLDSKMSRGVGLHVETAAANQAHGGECDELDMWDFRHTDRNKMMVKPGKLNLCTVFLLINLNTKNSYDLHFFGRLKN